jgi:hypothetical protein
MQGEGCVDAKENPHQLPMIEQNKEEQTQSIFSPLLKFLSTCWHVLHSYNQNICIIRHYIFNVS